MFVRYKGKTKVMHFKGDTAREVRAGSLVKLSDSGTVVPLRNDSDDNAIGVAMRNDTVSDSALVPVEVPVELAVEWMIDVDSDAGATDSDVGAYVSLDTVGGASVNAGDSCATRVDISDTSIRNVLITKVISTTKVVGTLCNMGWERGVGDSGVG